ncbi:hypothetical protein [Companilactobacillus hulinensis]|uniref:hypothetical protein n=1 Tax=Companilactobacillus hulinensis TaxID=2486007 RepID=UPI000F780CE3|nr:hypothetical protein [Companilactobacillus hulinensis]
MKLLDFLNLIMRTVIKLPAGVKIKKSDGTYTTIKSGDDMLMDISGEVYSKDQIDSKFTVANNNTVIASSADVTKLQEMDNYLNGTK